MPDINTSPASFSGETSNKEFKTKRNQHQSKLERLNQVSEKLASDTPKNLDKN